MAVQLLPIIKAVAPYVAQIATAAIPSFTSRSDAVKSDPALARQIEELQQAATQNAESIHVLAAKMQQAMEGMESAAREAQKSIAAYRTALFASLGLSIISVLASAYLLLH